MSLIPRLGRSLFDPLWEVDPFMGSLSSWMPSDSRIEGSTRMWAPRMDFSETDKEYRVCCDLPGLNKENSRVDIDEENRTLTISGKRESESKQENERFHVVERSYGDFKRTLSLPRNVDFDNISAKLENGILSINIPKTQTKSKGKTLQIQ